VVPLFSVCRYVFTPGKLSVQMYVQVFYFFSLGRLFVIELDRALESCTIIPRFSQGLLSNTTATLHTKSEHPQIITPQKYFITFMVFFPLHTVGGGCELLLFAFYSLNFTPCGSKTSSTSQTVLMLLSVEGSEWCISSFGATSPILWNLETRTLGKHGICVLLILHLFITGFDSDG
jgi:hypothetical protein